MEQTAIRTRGLTRRFGGDTVVDSLDLEVPTGCVCGFLGRNGAGKSTTIRMLMDLIRPSGGEASVLGMDPWAESVELKKRVGYVSDDPAMYGWMTVAETVWFAGSLYPRWDGGRVEGMLRDFGLDPDQKVKNLSRGMNAQLALALALGHDPELLILDEPASGLDVVVRRDFLHSVIQLIQEEGRTVFLSSHLVHEIERVADRVLIIDGGRKLVEGEIDEVKASLKKVVVRVGEGVGLDGIEGVRAVEGAGAHRHLQVKGEVGAALERVKAAGAEVVDVLDLSLEDVFVAYVGVREG